jgi:hypothetical protein
MAFQKQILVSLKSVEVSYYCIQFTEDSKSNAERSSHLAIVHRDTHTVRQQLINLDQVERIEYQLNGPRFIHQNNKILLLGTRDGGSLASSILGFMKSLTSAL